MQNFYENILPYVGYNVARVFDEISTFLAWNRKITIVGGYSWKFDEKISLSVEACFGSNFTGCKWDFDEKTFP